MKIKSYKNYILTAIIICAVAFTLVCVMISTAFAKTSNEKEVKRAVPFSEVEVNDGFMRDYIKLTICKIIPTAIANVEKPNGGMNNIKNCAKWHKGEIEKPTHEGALYVDSDVHKVLESMCMALDTPSEGDPEIEAAQQAIDASLQDWIPYYQWAPDQSDAPNCYKGYFDTYWSLDPDHVKYSNTDQHELYCQGHFIEAAVAHYRYTKNKKAEPDTRLFEVALNSADHISKTFGPNEGQRKQIPGHEEIELALIKLAKLCQEIGTPEYVKKAENYIDTAAFFLGVRGDYEGRTVDDTKDWKRPYYQDHARVEDQSQAVGHAVRAQYLYTGMCDLASIDPAYAKKYDKALTALWDDVTHKKQYVTGGIGDQRHSNEGFDDPYYLPNYGSYCETCAGVANMLWNRSMSTLYDGAKYADQIETDLYNNVLGCVNFDGDKFYYQNRICTREAFDRQGWYGTACCPPNLTRTILQLGGYVYNTTSNDVYVNQYISNKANFSFGANTVDMDMISDLPYKGSGKLIVNPQMEGNFNIHLRKPSWTDTFTIKINGVSITPSVEDDYIVIKDHAWTASETTIEFDFTMPLKYVQTDEKVDMNKGFLALRHGPILYCSESCDNAKNFEYTRSSIVKGGEYSFEKVESLDGKPNPYGVKTVYVLNHAGKYRDGFTTKDITWRLIPYYTRCNRELGAMQTFFNDSEYPLKAHQKAIASASNTYKLDSANNINSRIYETDMRWTSYDDDKVHPNPYVQYDFENPVNFKGFKIWWFDDNKGVRNPDSCKFDIYNSKSGTHREINVETDEQVKVTDDYPFKTYTFPDLYAGDKIVLTMFNEKSAHATGIVEWELIDAETKDIPTKIEITKQPDKTEYVLNENFDPSGMVVMGTFKDQNNNETTKQITDYTWDPITFTKSGKQEVTISYTVLDTTKTDSLTVDVKETVVPDQSGQQQASSEKSAQTGDNPFILLLPIALLAAALLTLKLKKNN